MPHKLGAAVDTDFVPNELQIADYGLVADLFEAVPDFETAL